MGKKERKEERGNEQASGIVRDATLEKEKGLKRGEVVRIA